LEKLLAQEVGKAKATASVARDYESLRGEAQLMKRQLAAQAGQSLDQYEKMLKEVSISFVRRAVQVFDLKAVHATGNRDQVPRQNINQLHQHPVTILI
jgi:hypothetical protein